MSVLVTGASGLVGSHVVEALAARGEPVRALVRPASRAAVLRLGAEAVAGDVTDPAAWQAAARGVRAIVHAAAIVQRRASWDQYVAVNVDGTRLAVHGPGTNRLSCVYAGNVASAAVAALDAPLQGFRVYNVTSDGPPALSQREFFAAFAAALGRRTWSIPIPTPLAGLVIGLFTARRLA